MGRTTIRTLLTIGLWIAGCGSERRPELGGVSSSGSQDPAPQPGSGPAFTLLLTGTDVGDFVSARMNIKSVEVRSAEALLGNAVSTRTVDLTNVGHSYPLTSFQAPSGVEDVEFVVAFGGGTVDDGKQSFWLDDSCDVLRMAGKVSKLSQRKHAVIQLDVARSFVSRGAKMALVPHFQLVY